MLCSPTKEKLEMKKVYVFASLLCVFASAFAQKPSDVPGKIVVEPDQTDIFAIPLDEDADEQQQELYNLEHPNGSKK